MAKKNKAKKNKVKDETIKRTLPESEWPIGLKERVKQGYMTVSEALAFLDQRECHFPAILGWLHRRAHKNK